MSSKKNFDLKKIKGLGVGAEIQTVEKKEEDQPIRRVRTRKVNMSFSIIPKYRDMIVQYQIDNDMALGEIIEKVLKEAGIIKD